MEKRHGSSFCITRRKDLARRKGLWICLLLSPGCPTRSSLRWAERCFAEVNSRYLQVVAFSKRFLPRLTSRLLNRKWTELINPLSPNWSNLWWFHAISKSGHLTRTVEVKRDWERTCYLAGRICLTLGKSLGWVLHPEGTESGHKTPTLPTRSYIQYIDVRSIVIFFFRQFSLSVGSFIPKKSFVYIYNQPQWKHDFFGLRTSGAASPSSCGSSSVSGVEFRRGSVRVVDRCRCRCRCR